MLVGLNLSNVWRRVDTPVLSDTAREIYSYGKLVQNQLTNDPYVFSAQALEFVSWNTFIFPQNSWI